MQIVSSIKNGSLPRYVDYLVCLLLCLFFPLWVLLQRSENYLDQVAAFKTLLLWITPVYFASGVIWMREWEKRRQ